MQPASSIARWNAHGINTKAKRVEPDGVYSPQIPFERIQAQYAEWKAINADVPVLINVTGSFNQHDVRDPRVNSEPWYREYFEGADWLTADRYRVNLGKPILAEVEQMFDKVAMWQGPERAKPWFAFIEAGDDSTESDRPSPGPTGPELRAEVWYAIIRGARGILYFPHQVAPTYADVTTAEVRAEMTTQHARITALAPVLQGELHPVPVTATAPLPLEVGWRVRDGEAFVTVANISSETRTDQALTVDGVALRHRPIDLPADPDDVERRITERARAIRVVHMRAIWRVSKASWRSPDAIESPSSRIAPLPTVPPTRAAASTLGRHRLFQPSGRQTRHRW